MKSIGGYLELELNEGVEYHQGALRLNTGRNAFEYILRAKKYKKVYIPYYTCDVILQPINRLGIEYEYYSINEAFEPIFNYTKIHKSEAFLYTNYFGLKDRFVSDFSKKCRNPIIDNSQAFFSRPIAGVDTFYSPRKFFGLPDGAYLYTNKFLKERLEQDCSYNRCEHLLRRIDKGPEDAYKIFVKKDQFLSGLSVKAMSSLTQKLLESIDYVDVAEKRRSNFKLLHERLGKRNKLKIEFKKDIVPLSYPYYPGENNLREQLIKNRIYTAQYWPNVIRLSNPNRLEHAYALNIVHLPISQMCVSADMKRIVNLIYRFDTHYE